MDVIDKNRIRSDQQHLYLSSSGMADGTANLFSNIWGLMEVAGVQNVTFNWDNAATEVEFLGKKPVHFAPDGPQIGQVNINTVQITKDQFKQFTGNMAVNGYVLRSKTDTTSNYSFVSGFLTEYTLTTNTEGLSEISASFEVYNTVGNIATTWTPETAIDFANIPNLETFDADNNYMPLQVSGPGSIEISIDDFSTNLVNSMTMTLSCPRNPIKTLGRRDPIRVEQGGYNKVNLNFEISQNNFNSSGLMGFPFSGKHHDVTINVRDYWTNTIITSHSFNNMLLFSEDYNASVGQSTNINMSFKGVF